MQARKCQVCPFEMCLDLADWADADDLRLQLCVRSKRAAEAVLWGRRARESAISFLVDEAHKPGAPGQGDVQRQPVCKEDFLGRRGGSLRPPVGRHGWAGSLGTGAAGGCWPSSAPGSEECRKRDPAGAGGRERGLAAEDTNLLALSLVSLMGELDAYMEDYHAEFPRTGDQVLDFYFCTPGFPGLPMTALDGRYADRRGRMLRGGRTPSGAAVLRESVDESFGNAWIREPAQSFFRQRLLPIRYYKTLLSGSQEDYAVYANSPFPEENRLLMVAEDVSSRYTRRARVRVPESGGRISGS